MSLNKNKILLFLFLFVAFFSYSQDKKKLDSLGNEMLGEIVITATRTIRQLSSLPMPVQLISKKDIRKSNTMRLAEILNEQTGLITVPDFGGGEGIQLQGLDSQYTLILIDGLPLIGRSAGTLDLNRISIGNIKQIEIVKGASSSLYGSEALGGVINIITEKPKFGFRGRAFLRTGSFGTNDVSLNLNHRFKKLGFTAFINRFSSKGFDFDPFTVINNVNPFTNYTFNSKVSYEFSDAFNMVFSGRIFTQSQDNILQDGDSGEIYGGESNIDEWNASITSIYKPNDKFESTLELYATRYKTNEYLNDSNGILFSFNRFNQFFMRPEWRNVFTREKSETSIGIGITHESLDRSFFSTTPVFNAPYVFTQYDWNPNDDWNIIIGARFDGHNQYESQFNPKLAINYDLSEKLSLKASGGRGFKAPDFRQLYFNFANSSVGYQVLGYNEVNEILPNLINQKLVVLREGIDLADFRGELKPESSVNLNLGLSYDFSQKIKTDINFFRNDISNLIDTRAIATFLSNGQNLFSYVNVDEVFTQGLEYNFSYKPNSNFKMSFGYQLLIAKDKDAIEEFKARRVNATSTIILTESQYFGLFNRSRHMGNFKIFYSLPKSKIDLNLRATFRSKFGLFDTNSNGYLDTFDEFANGYAIIDIAANKTIFKNYELGIGADNLFDYTDPQNLNNIPGRLIYGKLSVQF
ncbi:MAG: TonB-dependent receptor plug domain-containing protein [Polaribacter sp.]